MSFNWPEYLVLARVIAGVTEEKCTDEAKNRASISRAYYAAYNVANSFIARNKGKMGEIAGGPHQKVYGWFILKGRERRSKPLTRVGTQLTDLFLARKAADYHDSFFGHERARNTSLKQARDIIDTIEKEV